MYDYCRPPKNQRLVKTWLSIITHRSGREIWKCAYKSQIEYLKTLKTSPISQILLTWLHEITFMKVFKGLQIFLGGFHKVEEGSCRLFCKKSIYDYWRLPKKQRLFKTPTSRTTHKGGREIWKCAYKSLRNNPDLTYDVMAKERQNNGKILLKILSNIRYLHKDCLFYRLWTSIFCYFFLSGILL